MKTSPQTTKLLEKFKPHIEKMGREMARVSAKVQPGQKVLVWYDPECQMVADYIIDESKSIGAEVAIYERNLPAAGERLRNASDKELPGVLDELFAEEEKLMAVAENVIIARIEDPNALDGVGDKARAMFAERYRKIHARRVTGKQEWCLTIWPTEHEAEQENMTYEEYFQLCMEACNQPWEEIKQAQEELCKLLDTARVLELHANEDDPDPKKQTHLTMSIEGMTFCNSTIDANYPGSEVFSAPVRESVNGQVFAKGEYVYEGRSMRDLFFRFENGKIVEAKAGDSTSQTALDDLLNREGEGTRYLGEVAIGTNPALVYGLTANGLFAEKKAGSFHVAIGECYTFTEYDGKKVKLNNGNTDTNVHWDIAVSMVRQKDGGGGGRIVVDGTVVQKDGIFGDERLKVINPKL